MPTARRLQRATSRCAAPLVRPAYRHAPQACVHAQHCQLPGTEVHLCHLDGTGVVHHRPSGHVSGRLHCARCRGHLDMLLAWHMFLDRQRKCWLGHQRHPHAAHRARVQVRQKRGVQLACLSRRSAAAVASHRPPCRCRRHRTHPFALHVAHPRILWIMKHFKFMRFATLLGGFAVRQGRALAAAVSHAPARG